MPVDGDAEMSQTEPGRLCDAVAAELEQRYPLTERQLCVAAQRRGLVAGLAEVRRLLEQSERFTVAGEQPRGWRLARPGDQSTEACTACGQEKSLSRFRDTRDL